MNYSTKEDNQFNTSKEENNFNITHKSANNSMLVIMDGLIKSMQQLQEMIVSQNTSSNTEEYNKETKIDEINKTQNTKSQAALLLHQVQTAMEATVAQLSTNNRVLKPGEIAPIIEDKTDEKLSISEKWRMYTEMVQLKNESSKEYCIMKMRLGQELGLTFNETKREMLIGLWNNRLCIVLYLKKHQCEDEILNDIEEWEKIEYARNEIIKKYRRKYI